MRLSLVAWLARRTARFDWRLLPLGLLSACLSTEDVSLGALLHDAAPPETATRNEADAAPAEPTAPGSSQPDPAHEEEERGDDALERDAGLGAASSADASPEAVGVDASGTDAGAVDAGVEHAGHPGDAGSLDPDARVDAGRADAGDASVPLICILEPWHC